MSTLVSLSTSINVAYSILNVDILFKSATNRSVPNDITKYYNKDQITEWQIKEGTIQPK